MLQRDDVRAGGRVVEVAERMPAKWLLVTGTDTERFTAKVRDYLAASPTTSRSRRCAPESH